MNPIAMRPGIHQVLDTALAQKIREVTGDSSYFSYRHALTRNWVIARWINRNAGLAVESCLFNPDDNISMEAALESIGWQNAPDSLNSLRQMAEEAASQERSDQQAEEDEYEHMADMGDFLRSRVRTHMQDHPEWMLMGCDTSKCKVRA